MYLSALSVFILCSSVVLNMYSPEFNVGRSNTNMNVGRGRGVLLLDVPPLEHVVDTNEFCSSTPVKSGIGRGTVSTPYSVSPLQFTPSVTIEGSPSCGLVFSAKDASTQQFSELIKQIGAEIGESIKASLAPSSSTESTPALVFKSKPTADSPGQCSSTMIDASKLNLVLKSDVKEPPYFRGDGSDKYSVQEWEEIMKVYFRKKGYIGHELIEELVSKLVGKARDVVKVWLRNNPVLNSSHDSDAVFNILRQHFSESIYSSMPLADFYATKPKQNEGPLDYWIRLNKAAEVTEQCLRSQGKVMDNQSLEIAVMFIRNCPDKELAYVFKSKSLNKWTACEVQERLEEFHREHKATPKTLSQNTSTTTDHNQRRVGSSVNECKQSDVLLLPEKVCDADCAMSEGNTLDRVIGMLERALGHNNQGVQNCKSSCEQKLCQVNCVASEGLVCSICKSTEHTTISHCRVNRLCFKCHGSGHRRASCHRHMGLQNQAPVQTNQTQVQGN